MITAAYAALAVNKSGYTINMANAVYIHEWNRMCPYVGRISKTTSFPMFS